MSEQTSTGPGKLGKPDVFVPTQSPGERRIHIAPVEHRAWPYAPDARIGDDLPAEVGSARTARALNQFEASLPGPTSELSALRPALMALATGRSMNVAGVDFDGLKARTELAKAAEPENFYAAERRDHARWYQTTAPGEAGGRREQIDPRELSKSNPVAKAVLDVGTSQNFASITGGQSLGYVSLDTRMARGTVRPDLFTLYQALAKSAAYQVVDYWPYIDDPGGALPGSATSGFSNVQSGTLNTNAGIYSLQSINLKLMLDGRAVTLALMAQNNFVSINEQENANAALTVLGTADWLCYHGNTTYGWANQFSGLDSSITTSNTFDFQAFYNANASINSWSIPQALYNLIYEASAVITSWGRFGRITHAFMTPIVAGSLQGLVTTLLNQITNWPETMRDKPGIVVDGDLQGMRTRMGPIQFPMDLVITARDTPAQGQTRSNGTNPATTVSPTPPTGVVVTVATSGSTTLSNWGVNVYGVTSPFSGAATRYWYAVASTDINMNESTLTWAAASVAGSGIGTSGQAVVAIAGPAAADAVAYRVFRSGSLQSTSSGSATSVKFIGSIAASGTGTVNFIDWNAYIPGSERIYLLDLRSEDNALDFRYLLPLTRVELFAQNLYMPWAVCSIGAIRNRIPKFHGIIQNFIPDNPVWNPLGFNS